MNLDTVFTFFFEGLVSKPDDIYNDFGLNFAGKRSQAPSATEDFTLSITFAFDCT